MEHDQGIIVTKFFQDYNCQTAKFIKETLPLEEDLDFTGINATWYHYLSIQIQHE